MADVNTYANQLTSPAWAGDFLNREHLMPGGAKVDANQFMATDGAVVTLTANALVNAVSIAVSALANPIPSGTQLRFGAGKYAYTTANATAGAVTIAVEALPVALTNGDKATYKGTGMKPVTIVSGTLLGRTWAERDAGTAFGPAADIDEDIFFLAQDITDASKNNDADLYRHGGIVKENFVPGWANLSSTLKAFVRSRYQCTVGKA
ncbi:hypothetical protein [Herpetosiphon geysericola]|uniref:Head decoration protein n=1 Tax=Herpetosiphon geysericola TaxID=70996 RepID=A0A0P6Y8E3_9CHLR|nr:hypothetical protein [Herpetosiphon geysericola]KPL86163.1 hypothetical protein SE18_15015 [Herpetosiphon geysericola]